MRAARCTAFVIVILVIVTIGGRFAMPLMASALVHSDPLAPADLIVVLGSDRLERTLEAGTLFREGWSRRILLMHSPDAGSSGVLRKLNVHVPLRLDIQRDALSQMAIPSTAISAPVETQDTTRAEAAFTADYVRRAGFRKIIVVTSPYHTGRAGRFFRNAAGSSFTVIMRPNRYESIDPEHWWRHPLDRADVVFEYLKDVHALTFPDD